MKIYILGIIASFFYLVPCSAQQSSVLKKVHLLVKDATTGKPVAGADVKLRGVLLGKTKKTTDASGNVLFEFYPIGTVCTFEITHKNIHKPQTLTVSVNNNQNEYTAVAAVEQNIKTVTFVVKNAAGAIIPYALVTLDKEIKVAGSDGSVQFELAMAAEQRSISVIISKSGYKNYPYTIDLDNLAENTISVALQKTSVAYDMDNANTNVNNNQNSNSNVNQNANVNNTAGQNIQLTASFEKSVTYTPKCNANPIEAVPEFSSFHPPQDKSLSSYISDECMKPLNEAIEAISTFSNELKTMANTVESNEKNISNAYNVIDKTSTLVEKVGSFLASPPAYLSNCLAKGTIKFAGGQTAAEYYKMKEAYEDMHTVKEHIDQQMESLRSKLNNKQPVQNELLMNGSLWYKYYKAFTSALDIMTTAQNVYKKLQNPEDIFASEADVAKNATGRAKNLIQNLARTCKVLEAEDALKDATLKVQGALASARLAYAQNWNLEAAMRQKINDITSRYYPNLSNWEQVASKENSATLGVKFQGFLNKYNEFFGYQEKRRLAEKKRDEMGTLLNEIASLCGRLQDIFVTVNDRLKQYDIIYNAGFTSADECQFSKVEEAINKLRTLEKSECGLYLPKKGIYVSDQKSYSESLADKLKEARASEKCKAIKDGKPYEKKYGPFEIDLFGWKPTGITLKKGQYFRVQYDTTSKITYQEEGTGKTIRMWPDGHGYWGWFVLAAKLGEEIIHVYSNRDGYFKESGTLELGVPRWTTFVSGDGKGTTGSWRIYVYVTENY